MRFKFLIIIVLLSLFSFADDKIYLLPKETKIAFSQIEKLIDSSKYQIDIAMYNFSKKDLAKQLIKRHKKGVKVRVFFDSEKIKNKSSEYKLLKKNGIECFVISKAKLHTKLAIFDKETAIFGSLNWTKESFSENYEILYITTKDDIVDKLNHFIDKLKDE